MSSFSHPSHTNFYTDDSSGYCHPNTSGYQTSSPYASYASYTANYSQPPDLFGPPAIPYAVPVDPAPMASTPSQEPLDYSRPQSWRNMPQRQEHGSNVSTFQPPSYPSEQAVNRAVRSSSNVSTSSYDSTALSSTYSEAAMAANASVAADVAPGVNYSSERASVSSATSSATRSSVDAAVDTMWEARRAREKAEEEADQKLIDAVCKASLAEYNDRERALKVYESETSQRSLKHQESSAALQHEKSEAEQRKRAAMQTVIDSKMRAKLMSEKAREATSLYEQKNQERLTKQAELETMKLREAQEVELLAVQQRKEEAMRKRTEAELKARQAREKAEAMRHQAFQAASKVRANSRRQIETQLNVEEAQRQRECSASWMRSRRIKSLLANGRKRLPRKRRMLAAVPKSFV
eukprot:jgi/Phyca11/536188/estExt2_fgenesh1_pg.C_PHYCAscaffold_480075